jgi:hypothetical protein
MAAQWTQGFSGGTRSAPAIEALSVASRRDVVIDVRDCESVMSDWEGIGLNLIDRIRCSVRNPIANSDAFEVRARWRESIVS